MQHCGQPYDPDFPQEERRNFEVTSFVDITDLPADINLAVSAQFPGPNFRTANEIMTVPRRLGASVVETPLPIVKVENTAYDTKF